VSRLPATSGDARSGLLHVWGKVTTAVTILSSHQRIRLPSAVDGVLNVTSSCARWQRVHCSSHTPGNLCWCTAALVEWCLLTGAVNDFC